MKARKEISWNEITKERRKKGEPHLARMMEDLEDIHKKRKRDEDEPTGGELSEDDREKKDTAKPGAGHNQHLLIDAENPVLTLSEKERELFELLLSVVAHFKLETVLRAAGGWVRDKVLLIF